MALESVAVRTTEFLGKLGLQISAAEQVWSVKLVGRRFYLTHILRRLIIPPYFCGPRPSALTHRTSPGIF
jgi:hypothetical protein